MLDEALIRKYRHKGILVDTSLLVVYIVGTLGTRHLLNCRATKNFTRGDFNLLAGILGRFVNVVTTAHVLTEVSNLAGKLPISLHQDFRFAFRKAINRASEQSLPAKQIASDKDFINFGITDTAIRLISPGSYLVLTSDLPLFGLLGKRGVDVVNFNHLRPLVW